MRERSCMRDSLLPKAHVTRTSWGALLHNGDSSLGSDAKAGREYVTHRASGAGFPLIHEIL